MISGTHTVDIAVPPERLWTYLSNFHNWAEFVVGFQKFVVVDERTSVWTLRGDVGLLAREVELRVTLLDEDPGRRATYSITGITEQIEGTGTFEVAARANAATDPTAPADQDGSADAAVPERAARAGWWSRLLRRWALAMLRRQHAKDAKLRVPSASADDVAPVPGRVSDARDDNGDTAGSVLTFTLEVTPGGAMAPVVEMLMRPLLEPSAEDFSTRIRAQLEGTAHA